jgi:type I restriction enzyme M protein
MAAFDNFTNPYQNPADISNKYCQHYRLQERFHPDGRIKTPAEDPVKLWVIDIHPTHLGLSLEAMNIKSEG